MANNYFQFKQFRIAQDKCAMKVTTDACIQGAWTPVLPGITRVLDIGAGTGLLSLMLAQRNPDIIIDAIEFDHDAAAQAMENVGASNWKERINIVKADARSYRSTHKYDLIISNPPFFNNSLLSDKESKNMARHTLSLTYAELIQAISVNLSDDGYASIILPTVEYVQWSELMAEAGYYEFDRLSVSHRPNAPVKRVVGLFQKKVSGEKQKHNLVIRGNDDAYTPAFIELLSPFYLDL